MIIPILAALGGVGGYLISRDRLEQGSPTTASAAVLRGQTTQTGQSFRITGGSLAWDERFVRQAQQDLAETGHYQVRFDGKTERVDSLEGAMLTYEMVVALLGVANRLSGLFHRTLTPEDREWFWSGRRDTNMFRLSGLNAYQIDLLTHVVNAWLQFGTALRLLSRVYRANSLRPSVRPASAARHNVSLDVIVCRGLSNPLTRKETGAERIVQITDARQWELLGQLFISETHVAYAPLVQISSADADVLYGDFEPTQGAMGAVPVMAIGVAISLVIATIGAVVVIKKLEAGVLLMMGANVAYMNALVDAYEDAVECCLEETDVQKRQHCCAQAEMLADRIESWRPGFWGPVMGVLVGTGVVIGGWALYKVASRRQWGKRIAGRARKQLTREGP